MKYTFHNMGETLHDRSARDVVRNSVKKGKEMREDKNNLQ